MSDGPSSEVPKGEIEKRKPPVILSKEERAAIAESLKARGIFFGIYPVEGGRDASHLEPHRDLIESIGLATLAEVTKEIPIKDVHIGVFDKSERIIPEYGIGGYTHGYHNNEPLSLIEIDFDSDLPNTETAIENRLRRTMRHELHHDRRFDSLGQDKIKTLLDSLIFEGLGGWAEIEGSNEEPAVYSQALTAEQIPLFLERAKQDFASEDFTLIEDWMHGSAEKDIPHWAGHTLGFYLVGEYLKKHPDKKPSTLYDIPAEEFIKSLTDTTIVKD